MVQDNRAELLVSPGIQENGNQSPPAISNPVNEQDLNSERELLTSMYLVKLALADLPVPPAFNKKRGIVRSMMHAVVHLPANSYGAMHNIPNLTPRDAWAMDVASHLDAEVVKRSNVIEIEYTAGDPHWTKVFLDRLIAQYMDVHAHISHDPQAQHFYEDQTKQLRERLEQSSATLRDYQLKTGIGNLEDQKHELIRRIADLQNESAKTFALVSSADQQITTITKQMQTVPMRLEKESRSVQNQSLGQLKPQVMQLRAERAELLSRYLPTSEKIKQIDAKLASEEKILADENHLEVTERSIDLNPTWLTLDAELKQATTNSAAQKASQAELGRQIEAAQQQLSTLVTNGVDFDRLQRQVVSDKEAYVAYVRKTEEARTAQALNVDKILNVSVAQPPGEPMQPVFPSLPLNLAVGFILATALALAAAYWAEERDPRIYSSATVSQATGLPIVAIIAGGM
jgi:uncharacterized protein involved in exopolysaccharide biosynthesis